MTLPEMPAGLTASWLTDRFRESGLLGEGRIDAVEREQVGDGTGMMSEVARLRFRFAGDPGNTPASVVAKYPSTNPTNRASAMAYNLYERETRYFAELDALTPALTPRTYFADWHDDNFLILMEDLGAYRVGNQAQGADLADSQMMIDELAKLHGTFWRSGGRSRLGPAHSSKLPCQHHDRAV